MKKSLVIVMMLIVAGWISVASAGDKAIPLIIDVRTDIEYQTGHVKGAVNLLYTDIGETIGSVAENKSQKIYVYCRSGRRSQIAKTTLEKLGYNNVVDLGTLKDAAKTLNRKIVQ
jgi:phage shock protein E